MTLPDLIRSKGYSVLSFCRWTGISKCAIYSAANGARYERQSSTIPKIAEALGVTVKDIEEMTGSRMLRRHPIEEEILNRGMTVRQFADRTNIPYETIRGVMTGKVDNPRPDTIEWIYEELEKISCTTA